MGLFNKKPKIVTCDECNCLLEKDNAQKVGVLITELGIAFGTSTTHYYCKKDTKNYDRIEKCMFHTSYFKEVEVDENGEPLGYTKVPDRVVVTSKNVQEVVSKVKKALKSSKK